MHYLLVAAFLPRMIGSKHPLLLNSRRLSQPASSLSICASRSPAFKILSPKPEPSRQARRTLLLLNPDGPLLRRRQQQPEAGEAASAEDMEVRLASLAAILRANELLDTEALTEAKPEPVASAGGNAQAGESLIFKEEADICLEPAPNNGLKLRPVKVTLVVIGKDSDNSELATNAAFHTKSEPPLVLSASDSSPALPPRKV